MRKIAATIAIGIVVCMALAASFAQDGGENAVMDAGRHSEEPAVSGLRNENRTPEEIRIDEWGSIWIGADEEKSELKKLAEAVGSTQLPLLSEVVCNGTTPVAITLEFETASIPFRLELIERKYNESSETSAYAAESAYGAMEFLVTIENYLNLQSAHGEMTPSYEGVYLYF